ncbi:MAG: ATP-binding cassette domain-containing protein [Eubacteriales bacterium]
MKTIEIKGVSKDFGRTKALDDLNLIIEPNKIYGLLGRNGAGKTTLLNVLTNRLFPTSGEIIIDGETVNENDAVLSSIYYMTEQNLYPEGDKIKGLFKWTKEFYPGFDIDYANKLSDKFELDTNKKVKALSTGYKSIFKAILTLASNAAILLFDEPVLGLDAYHRELFYKEVIANYNNHPKTMIVSTHLIEEAARVIEVALVIKKGKLIIKESVEELLMNSYMISGESSRVDQYIQNKKALGVEYMGPMKSVVLLERLQKDDENSANDLKLEIGKIELQKLFISLTEEPGGIEQ